MKVEIGSCWKPLPSTGGWAVWCVTRLSWGGYVTARTVRPDGSLTKTTAHFAASYLAANYRRVPPPNPSGTAHDASSLGDGE